MPNALRDALANFTKDKEFKGTGPISVALVITDRARQGLPLDPDQLLAKSGTQVKGLGPIPVKAILKRHGITRHFSSEAGRTSRGSVKNMQEYVAFLNDAENKKILDIDDAELYWVEQVLEFWNSKPFGIKLDASRGLRAVVRDVIAQAQARQKGSTGTNYAGAVLQYLVGAKLDCALGIGHFEHNNFTTADAPSGRSGDFLIGDVAVHVKTSPSESLLHRCEQNLNGGYRPIIVTTQRGLPIAEGLAGNKGLADRIDVFEIEQFVALNLYELGKFATEGRRTAVKDLVERYNVIIDDVASNPSLKIEFKK
jgi:hypothetical protein